MKLTKMFLILVSLSPLTSFGQAVQFWTLPPTGDVQTSSGDSLIDNALLSYGTFSITPDDFLNDITALTSGYSQIGTFAFSSGEVNTGTVTLSAGQTIYFWAFNSTNFDTSSEYALFGGIVVPESGTTVTTANLMVNDGLVLLGGTSGAAPSQNITLVPEPAHYAAVLGALGLGLVMWNRRRR